MLPPVQHLKDGGRSPCRISLAWGRVSSPGPASAFLSPPFSPTVGKGERETRDPEAASGCHDLMARAQWTPSWACSRPRQGPFRVHPREALVGPAAQLGKGAFDEVGVWDQQGNPSRPQATLFSSHSPGSSDSASLEPACHGPTLKD